VHWCSCGVRFNEVPEKAPKLPEKVWEALVQTTGFRRRFVREKVGEALVQSQVRFLRVPGKVPERFQRRSRSLRWLSGSTGFRRRLGRRFRRRFGRL